MTDKIIIDGVNVSGCDYLVGADYCWCDHCNCYEKRQFNCYYKQLKRKEEECEIYRKANNEKNEFLQSLGISAGGERKRIIYYIDKLQEQNKSLQQELRTEKEKVKELEKEKSILKSWSRHLEQWKDNLLKENGCYKQALEEIRDILDKPILDAIPEHPQCQGMFMMEYDARTEQRIMQLEQILQKCEELDAEHN